MPPQLPTPAAIAGTAGSNRLVSQVRSIVPHPFPGYHVATDARSRREASVVPEGIDDYD
ncbi:hypothetical protein ACFOY2_22100 [Nonomuraea purpurea]|uniref:Uncharacterized protein n=1 Tax=Nonomuraea purpurea TaxID=1849276 RepID=A0ABV8GB00_9ACTN